MSSLASCRNCDKEFAIREWDLNFYETIQVPLPTWCPECRHMRRHGHINDYNFYSRSCDECGKNFISIFPGSSNYTVLCQECWYAEGRNDKAEGRDYDETRSFFEQFNELMHKAPQLGLIGMNNENCSYCESVANCRNCYLVNESSNCEDSFYSYWIQKTKDSVDCSYAHECELCYECTNVTNCFNLFYSQHCKNSSDSYFLDNCSGCKNSFLSTNLCNKEYYIYNTPYTKEEYEKIIAQFDFGNIHHIEDLRQKFIEFLKTQPRKNLQIESTENCTGNHIWNAKNCFSVFHCYEAEECAYGEHIWRNAKYCVDSNTAGRNAELLYETTNSGIDSYNVRFSRYCWGCNNTEYSNQCKNGTYLFGCVSLKPGARYCILNKQYSKEEYVILVEKIKARMLKDKEYGEFFPLSISLFGYNDTVSGDEYPLEEAQIKDKGWKWEHVMRGTVGRGTVSMKLLPSQISQTGIGVLNELLTCVQCEKNYKIIKQEFAFYKRQNIPLPRLCFHCRHMSRIALYGGRNLLEVECSNCTKPTKTYYQDSQLAIWCEECYSFLVY